MRWGKVVFCFSRNEPWHLNYPVCRQCYPLRVSSACVCSMAVYHALQLREKHHSNMYLHTSRWLQLLSLWQRNYIFLVLDLLYYEKFVLVAKPKINILCVHKSCLGRGSKRVLHNTRGMEIARSAVQHQINPWSLFYLFLLCKRSLCLYSGKSGGKNNSNNIWHYTWDFTG